jgi:hypothetical protein
MPVSGLPTVPTTKTLIYVIIQRTCCLEWALVQHIILTQKLMNQASNRADVYHEEMDEEIGDGEDMDGSTHILNPPRRRTNKSNFLYITTGELSTFAREGVRFEEGYERAQG